MTDGKHAVASKVDPGRTNGAETRLGLLGRLEASTGERRRLAPIVDAVLDEVLAMARPRLDRDYSGSEVLQQLLRWRGEP